MITNLRTLLPVATTAALAAVAMTTAGCSSTSSGRVAPKDRGSADFNTAILRVDLNGAVRPIVVELYPEDAPRTVANFKDKVLAGHYDGMAFHRVIPRFAVQTGDPLSKDDALRDEWGTGGNEETLPAEIKLKHQKGAVAMARLSANNPAKRSSASQFYITLTQQSRLDGDYTVFGQVVQGMDVLDDMGKVVVDSNDNPLRRIDLVNIVLVPQGAEVDDPGSAREIGGRRSTTPDSSKGPFTRFIERIW